MSILTQSDRVKNSIELGESHFREFKTALEGKPENKNPRLVKHIAREIGEALVAFANADGGELLIGVEDDGTITGLKDSRDDIQKMRDAPKQQIMHYDESFPLQACELISIEGHQILFFSVSKGTSRVYQTTDGRCMKRQDKSTVPVLFDNLIFERQEQISRDYDRTFVDGATTADLDINLVQTIANDYIRGMSPEQYLQQLSIAEYGIGGLRLRRAAILLFAKDIQKWYPRCQVRIMSVNGISIETGAKYNVVSDESVNGNIFELLKRSWDRLSPYLSQKVTFGLDAKFEQTFSYPENACREALINAIAHRSYVIQNPINVYLYDNRLVFESPGELLSTICIADLRKGCGVHESRNTYIAKVLRENK